MNRRTRPSERGSPEGDSVQPAVGSARFTAGPAAYQPLRSWAVATGLVVATVGVGVMIGWLLDAETLVRIGPGLATMKFNTALCLALLGAGVAAGIHSRVALVDERDRWRRSAPPRWPST